MASAKESSRQKMIGMMYLVLTALLALNVSKEILNAFVVINESLGKTTDNLSNRNEKLYTEFDVAKNADPVRVTANWKEAQEVKKRSLELSDFIIRIKKELLMKTEGIKSTEADTLQLANANNKDNTDVTTNIMIGQSEDGSAGYSGELKTKLIAYKTQLESLIDPRDKARVSTGLVIEDPKHGLEKENWELYNFHNTPLAAGITILSKLETDVKNAESVVVDYLLRKYDVEIMKFDTIAPKVIPQSNYVMLGEDYKADVFIAAFSKTQNPKVLAGELNKNGSAAEAKLDTVNVSGGIGKYLTKTTREGIFKWGGTISLKSSSGKTVTYPYESEYIVARPAINVSADKMNVFYEGIQNPVTISVPGVPNERIVPSISTGKLISLGNGKYMVEGVSGSKVNVTVTATMENGEKRAMGSAEFRVKQLPTPSTAIDNYDQSCTLLKAKVKALSYLRAQYEKNFEFKLTSKVTRFTIDIINSSGISSRSFTGYQIAGNQAAASFLSNVKVGDRIVIEEVKAMGPDGRERKLNDVTFKVN